MITVFNRHDCMLFLTGSQQRGLSQQEWLPLLTEKLFKDAQFCRLQKTSLGQPSLILDDRHVFCSISHAIGLTAITCHDYYPIGVDVELIDETQCDAELIEKLFPDHAAPYYNTSDNDPFLSHWTRKEAFLKAKGTGFIASEGEDLAGAVIDEISWIEQYGDARWRISKVCLKSAD